MPAHWSSQLETFHAQAWTQLRRGVGDRLAPCRHPTLATVSPQGWPQARTVVLRAADAHRGHLEVHTHRHSVKVAELTASPWAALHVWDAQLQLQIRLQAQVSLVHGEQAADAWSRVPMASRGAYQAGRDPGQPLDSSPPVREVSQPEAFTVVRLEVVAMDLLHLGEPHRRAVYRRDQAWQGQWVVP